MKLPYLANIGLPSLARVMAVICTGIVLFVLLGCSLDGRRHWTLATYPGMEVLCEKHAWSCDCTRITVTSPGKVWLLRGGNKFKLPLSRRAVEAILGKPSTTTRGASI